MKEAEKNPSDTIYRCDFLWRIRFRCRNWGEMPGTRSNLGLFGITLHLRFFQHRVNRKKISPLGKNPSRQAHFMKEAEKNPSDTIYRCDFLWRIRFRCRNWGEMPGTRSNLGLFGITLHLRFFQHRVNRKKISPLGKNPSRQAHFMKEAEKNHSATLYRCDFSWRIGFWCRNWAEKPGTRSNLGLFGNNSSLEIFPT